MNPILYEKNIRNSQENDLPDYLQDEEMHKLFATYINFDLFSIANEDKINNFLNSLSSRERENKESELNTQNLPQDNLQYPEDSQKSANNGGIVSAKGFEGTFADTNEQVMDFGDFSMNSENYLRTVNLFRVEDNLNDYTEQQMNIDETEKKHAQFKFDKTINYTEQVKEKVDSLIENSSNMDIGKIV